MAELISPVDPCRAPYQTSQRYLVLDERHVGNDDLPSDNLMAAVIGLRSRAALRRSLLRVMDRVYENGCRTCATVNRGVCSPNGYGG